MSIPVCKLSFKRLMQLVIFALVSTDSLKDAKFHLRLSLCKKTLKLSLAMLEVVLTPLLLVQ